MAVILIVEDDAMLCLEAEAALQEWGHETLVASDVDGALSIIRSAQKIDVLFTDIYLKTEPRGGCDLAREAIRLRPDLRVLYVTGYTLTAQVRALFVEGARCLGKPYADNTLKESIQALLAENADSAAT